MATDTVFPIFSKIEHKRDGSAKAAFIADVNDLLNSGQRKLSEFGDQARRTLDQALSVSRNTSGSLDLGVPQMREAAAAAQARAVAAREVAAATVLAAREEGQFTQATRLAIAASRQLATEEERDAAAKLALANASERVQAVLLRQKSATDVVTAATRRGTTVNSSSRIGLQQLGYQFNDFATQIAAGTSPAQAFAQQIGQTTQAVQLMAGGTSRLATFLGGPWGILLGVGLVALGPLVAKLFETGEASDQAKAAAEKLALAFNYQNTATHEVVLGLDELIKKQREQNDVGRASAVVAYDQANANIRQAIAVREILAAELDRRNKTVGEVRALGEDTSGAEELAGITKRKIAEQAAAITRLRGLADKKFIPAAQETVDDPAGAASKRALAALNKEYDVKKRITAEEKAQYNIRYAKIKADEKAAEDAQREANRKRRPDSADRQFGREIDVGQAKSIAERAGFRFTDDLRTVADQRRLYNTVRTKENPVAYPSENAPHVAGRALDIAFGPGVTPASIRKAYAEEGVKLTKLLKETGHFHIEFSTSGADKVENEAERIAAAAAKAKEALKQFGALAAESIAKVNERFNEQPRLIDQAVQATRALDKTIADLASKTDKDGKLPAGFQQMIKDANAAKTVIEDALVRPFAELEQSSTRRFEIAKLTLSGRDAEASALENIYRIEGLLGTEEELRAKVQTLINEGKTEEAAILQRLIAQYPALKQNVRDLAKLDEQRNEALQKASEIQGAYLDATRSIRSEIEGLLSGDKPNFKRIFKQLQGKILFEQIFGDVFRDLEKNIRRNSGIDESVDKLVKNNSRAGDSAGSLADAFDDVVRRLQSTSTSGGATGGAGSALDGATGRGSASSRSGLGAIFDGVVAGIGIFGGGASKASNDNGGLQANGDIVVVGKKGDGTLAGMSPAAYGNLVGNAITKPFAKSLDSLIPGLSGVAGGALGGYATGGIPGGIIGALKNIGGLSKGVDGLPNAFGKVLGKAGGGAATGTAVAGIAKALGIKKFSTTGSQIGGAIGSALPIPGGQIIGSIIGGAIGGLFKRAKTGSATLGIGSDGVVVGSSSGNSSSRKKAAGDLGGGISDSLNRIAEQLGGTADGPISVSIGISGKSFRVDPTGKGATSTKKGAIDFGQDQEAAIKFAIADAIKDGVIKGISLGAQRLISSGKDIEQQLKKAIDFESVFAQLKAIKDPVGAALDTLDKEFVRLKGIFTEAGASTADYAKLEELYGVRRSEAVKQAIANVGGSLKGLIDDLTIGNDAL